MMGCRPGGAPASMAGKLAQGPERVGVSGRCADRLSGKLDVVEVVKAEPRGADRVGTETLPDTVVKLLGSVQPPR
jgi:hypothetical protein